MTSVGIRESIGVDSFVLDTGVGDHIMKATMNRYRPTSAQPIRSPREPGYILIFGHGVGFHKEQWTPIIERLFESDIANNSPTRILEAWSIDYQSHGEAAALNKELFEQRPDLLPSVREYGEAFANLYRSGLLGHLRKGIHRLVLIGHSAGAIGCVYGTSYFGSLEEVPFDMVIMVDPAWFGPNGDEASVHYRIAEKTTPARRYHWRSKEAAYEWMKSRFPWKAWDPRILKMYTEHGLCPASGSLGGVELVCNPIFEAAAFSAIPDNTFLNNHMRQICGVIPFHLAFGSRSDLFSRRIQDSLHDPHVGHVFESITRIDGGGHLIVQEEPDRVADYLYSVLKSGARPTKAPSQSARL